MTTCTSCTAAIPAGTRVCPACLGPQGDAGRPAVATSPEAKAPEAMESTELLERVRRQLADDYEVHAELGRGGMAVVYKATELELLRPVALKVLPPEFAASPTMAERFKREARMAASFDHPNIIPIYRVGQSGGLFYIAMKFIEGKSLDDIIEAQGPLPIPVVMHVLRAAVRALAFAHHNHVVHRDIKGANILIDPDGRVVVSDFGIARAGEDAGMTATGALMGTPYFMSPEQCAGHRVGQQSDQYSLGVVLFQMLTGTVPFRAETIPGVMQHHFFTPVPDIRDVRKDVPEPLVEVVTRALAKRPADRYPTTREMQQAVERIPFSEAERRQGEAMLRDLVLGVSVPKVDAGVLPPLAETLMMTPPLIARARLEQVEKRSRRVTVGAAVLAAVALGGLGLAVAMSRGGAGETAATRAGGAARGGSARGAPPGNQSAAKPAAARNPTVAGRTDRAGDSAATRGAPPKYQSGSEPSAGSHQTAAARTAASPTSASAEGAPASAASSGKVRIRAYPPDADILVDGRSLGRGVVLDSLVPAGTRRLRVSAPGYVTLDTNVTVRAGETTQIGIVRLAPVGDRP